MRQFVQERLPLCPSRHRLQDLAPQLAKLGHPGSQIRRQLCVNFPPQSLGQRRALTSGRDRDLQIAALHDRRKEEVAQRRIIGSVAQDMLPGGFLKDCAVHLPITGGSDDQIATGYVCGFVSREPAS